MITINNLSKIYETKKVLSIENLEFPKGQTIGLVGNNGAGKTTLFSLILDLIEPSSGFVSIDGEKVNESENWKNKVGAFIDETFLIGYLTPEEYFYFLGELRGQSKANVDEFLKNFTDFFNGEILNAKKYIRDLSKGNMKKVGIIGALIGTPALIILDEPFANLDPSTQIKLKNLIRGWSQNSDSTFELVKDIQTSPETLRDLEQYFADQVSVS